MFGRMKETLSNLGLNLSTNFATCCPEPPGLTIRISISLTDNGIAANISENGRSSLLSIEIDPLIFDFTTLDK